jgi:hypothetical protein
VAFGLLKAFFFSIQAGVAAAATDGKGNRSDMIIARKIIIHQKPQIAQINVCLSLPLSQLTLPDLHRQNSSQYIEITFGALLKRKNEEKT